jgi:hypothetical protein
MSGKVPTLREIKSSYSPEVNPLMQSVTVPVKKSRVRSGLSERPLVDGESGELVAASVIHQIQDTDADQFVKVFSAGIAAAYELGRTGQRVFQAVLQEYEKTPMHGGFADSVYLAWFDQGLSGRSIGMSEKTFNRGLRELLDKGFIAARTPGVYWVNPALFFKGDRVMFVKEYRRASRTVNAPSVASITGTSHAVAPVGGASRPRPPKPVISEESRETTKPHHAPEKPVQPANGFRFGKKAKKRVR